MGQTHIVSGCGRHGRCERIDRNRASFIVPSTDLQSFLWYVFLVNFDKTLVVSNRSMATSQWFKVMNKIVLTGLVQLALLTFNPFFTHHSLRSFVQ